MPRRCNSIALTPSLLCRTCNNFDLLIDLHCSNQQISDNNEGNNYQRSDRNLTWGYFNESLLKYADDLPKINEPIRVQKRFSSEIQANKFWCHVEFRRISSSFGRFRRYYVSFNRILNFSQEHHLKYNPILNDTRNTAKNWFGFNRFFSIISWNLLKNKLCFFKYYPVFHQRL